MGGTFDSGIPDFISRNLMVAGGFFGPACVPYSRNCGSLPVGYGGVRSLRSPLEGVLRLVRRNITVRYCLCISYPVCEQIARTGRNHIQHLACIWRMEFCDRDRQMEYLTSRSAL